MKESESIPIFPQRAGEPRKEGVDDGLHVLRPEDQQGLILEAALSALGFLLVELTNEV